MSKTHYISGNQMLKEIFSGRSFGLGLIFAILLSPTQSNIHFLFFPLIIVLLLILEKTDFILLLIISSFFIISRNMSSELRDILQYLNLGLLAFLFIRRNAVGEISFPKISKELIQFLVIYFTTLFVSSLFAAPMFGGIEHILRQIVFFGIVYIIYSLISSVNTIFYLISAIIIAALFHTLVTIYSLYQVNFDIVAFGSEYFLSLGSDLLSNKNTIAIYIFYAMFFNFALYRIYKNVYFKYLSLFITTILLTGLLLINSRALILAVFIALLYLLFNIKRKTFYYTLIISVVFVVLLFIPPIDELVSFYFRIDGLFGQRDIITKSTWSLIENEWLLGTGPAGTKAALYKYIPFMLGSPEELWMRHHFNQIEYGHAHNYFLFMLSDLGVIGFIASVFLIYAYMTIGNRVRRFYYEKDPMVHTLILTIISLGIGMFVRGFFEWGGILGYGMINTDLPFWLSLVILVYFDQKRLESKAD